MKLCSMKLCRIKLCPTKLGPPNFRFNRSHCGGPGRGLRLWWWIRGEFAQNLEFIDRKPDSPLPRKNAKHGIPAERRADQKHDAGLPRYLPGKSGFLGSRLKRFPC